MAICIVHVNLFMLLTGYFLSNSRFKLKKVISFVLQLAFYNFIINIILILIGVVDSFNVEFITQIFFLNFKNYWFFSCYIILYFLSPFINKFISLIDRKTFKKLIICLLVCFSILPFLTTNLFFETNGYTVYQFVMMYFIGAYIKKYDVVSEIKGNLTKKRLTFFSIYIVCAIINLFSFYTSVGMKNIGNEMLTYIADNMINYFLNYNNPIIIIQSISFFLLFGTFQFKNKTINKISSLTFGIYLIHENYYIRQKLYKWLGIVIEHTTYQGTIIFKVFLLAMVIFVGCSIIEWLRQLLFKSISTLKILKKIDKKLLTWLNNLIEVN